MDSAEPLRVHALIDSLSWGGAEMLLGDFAAAAPEAGIELSVGYLSDHDGSPAAPRLRRHGIEPVEVGVRTLLGPTDLRRVRRHVADVRPDLVHTHLSYSDVMGGLAARSLGLPAVSTVHLMDRPGAARTAAKARLAALVRRRCMRRVITVSEEARRALLSRGGERAERVVCVRNGVVDDARPGAGRAVRAELGLGEDELVVSMLAVLRPGKGHDVAAAAVAALRERHRGLRLVIAGDGPARREVERLVSGLDGAAVVTGHRDDVAALLDATDVLLHPSSMDALPTALIEAMAAGVPVVSTRVGGIPEIVESGREGVLVQPPPTVPRLVGALEPLLCDRGLRARMGAAGRTRFEREFAAPEWAKRLRALYEEVRSEAGAAAR